MSAETYDQIDVSKLKTILGRKALVQWEEAPGEWGNTGLIRPETHTKIYFTGVILKCGDGLTDELKEGDRVFFGQFSGFNKFSDPKYGRVALVDEEAIECVLPPRGESKVEDGGTYR